MSRKSASAMRPLQRCRMWRSEMSIDRMKQRGNAADAFENEPFLMACAAIYSSMEMPWLHRIEADGSIAEVHARVRDVLREELGV